MRWLAVYASLALACAPRALPPRAPIEPPRAPDYADDASWAARPDLDDGADTAAPDHANAQASAPIDVFFVHPTTHFGRGWNAAFDEPRAARWVDTLVLPHQAAAFNGVGRVFAPRYRQAAIWSFTTQRDREHAERAMSVAYSDVARAFDAWLERSGDRPVIVAAHSQGSYHALRLLAERFERDDALRRRLVAAYLVGIPLPLDVFERTIPSVPLCSSADQVGCVLTWNTALEGQRPSRLARPLPIFYPNAPSWESTAHKPLACTNPVLSQEGWAPAEAHAGGVLFVDAQGEPIEPRVEPRLTRTHCADGVLEVEQTVPLRYRRDPLGLRGDLHLADYPLFFVDIARDAARRAEAHARANGEASPRSAGGG
jgi:pimeloyl-ACP methyl ester carboxylesterase